MNGPSMVLCRLLFTPWELSIPGFCRSDMEAIARRTGSFRWGRVWMSFEGWALGRRSLILFFGRGTAFPSPFTPIGGNTRTPSAVAPVITLPADSRLYCSSDRGRSLPLVSASSFTGNGQSLEHCVFDETSYHNGDMVQQNLGRTILNARDAVILIPRLPLAPGSTYTASITANGQVYSWTFSISVQAGESGSRFFPGLVK